MEIKKKIMNHKVVGNKLDFKAKDFFHMIDKEIEREKKTNKHPTRDMLEKLQIDDESLFKNTQKFDVAGDIESKSVCVALRYMNKVNRIKLCHYYMANRRKI